MNHPSNENIPSRSFSYHAFNFTFLLLLAVFFISLYTVALLKSNSHITLTDAVERNISCSDVIHQAISSRLTRADFEQINTKSDMSSAQYRSLQSYLNELRSLNSTRYLYTAKRDPDGKPIYLIDGLDLDAPDFAYPGTYLEKEMVPYLDAALSGETVYSQKIIDTTWGHIFTACYPVIASDGTNDILGYAELARNHLQEPEKLGEYMDKIHISGEKLLSIINNILQFSQIENNQTHIEETSVQTEESFDSCIVMVQTALEAGMNDHVAKPIDMKVLMNVLEEQICGRKGS